MKFSDIFIKKSVLVYFGSVKTDPFTILKLKSPKVIRLSDTSIGGFCGPRIVKGSVGLSICYLAEINPHCFAKMEINKCSRNERQTCFRCISNENLTRPDF